MKTTISDIAKQAGVSKATVSRVLNDHAEGVGAETRARIKALIAETGFQPCGVARGLATGKSRSVGLVIPDIANAFFPPLVRGVEEALRQRGYSLFLCDSDRDVQKEKDNLRVLLEKRVDGILLSSTITDYDGRLDPLNERGVPYVLLDRIIDARGAGVQVYVDNRKGARMAMEYLIRGGCRRPLFINGEEGLSISRLRREGVEDACREAGTPACTYRAADYTLAGAEALVDSLLDAASGELPFDAIFAGNDMMAVGALRSLKRHGRRVPEDVEIIGFDDVEVARLVEPALTTIAQPAAAMGAAAAELLLRLIDGEKPLKRSKIMEPTLVVRQSTRPR